MIHLVMIARVDCYHQSDCDVMTDDDDDVDDIGPGMDSTTLNRSSDSVEKRTNRDRDDQLNLMHLM